MEKIKLLVLRITERCNLRCTYCYAAGNTVTPCDMDEETAFRAIEMCCPRGDRLRIQLTGGEPLLMLDLIESIAAFGKRTGRKLSLSVQTNGTLLTKDVCRRLKALSCAVGVSIDGVWEADLLRVMGDGSPSYPKTAEGIRNLGEAGIRCGITTVITNNNARFLGKLTDMSLFFGNVGGIGLDLFRPIGRGVGNDLFPTKSDLESGLGDLGRKYMQLRNAGIPIKFREAERIKSRCQSDKGGEVYCYAQTSESLCVDAAGNMWPCSSLAGDRRFFLGNIENGEPVRTKHQAKLLSPPEECRKCCDFDLCLGGCPASRVAQKENNGLCCIMHRVIHDVLKTGER